MPSAIIPEKGSNTANVQEKHVFSTGKGGTLTVSSESVGRAAMFLNCPSSSSTAFSPKSKAVLSDGSPGIQSGIGSRSRQATHSVSVSRVINSVNSDQCRTGSAGPPKVNCSKDIIGSIMHTSDSQMMTSASGPFISTDIEKPKVSKRSAD